MKVRKITVSVVLSVIIVGISLVLLVSSLGEPNVGTKNMEITSSAFVNNSEIPVKYTCRGQNINPPLTFSMVPDSAKSLVLLLEDPDAPSGTFVHWVVYNLSPKTTDIGENQSFPFQGKTSAGRPGYVGPCPPSGTHHYLFKLYALDTVFQLNNPDWNSVYKEMQGHILARAQLTGLYGR